MLWIVKKECFTETVQCGQNIMNKLYWQIASFLDAGILVFLSLQPFKSWPCNQELLCKLLRGFNIQ